MDSQENRGMSCITTKHWSAKIADRNSFSLQESRNFTQRRVLRTSPFVARLAATSARQREARANPNARCTRQFAQLAEILARFPSSLARIALYTVTIATRSNKVKKQKTAWAVFCFCSKKVTLSVSRVLSRTVINLRQVSPLGFGLRRAT